MRLFIAANFSEETRKGLLDFRNELRSLSERGRFTSPENLHLTLVFLGECDAKQADAAKRSMDALVFDPFIITIAGVGYFDKGRPNLVFCELQNNDGQRKLCRLQSELSENLSVKGFRLEQRKFWPHITLGREVVWKDMGDYSNSIDVSFSPIEEWVTCFELMKSERINGKLIYTSIHKTI